MLSIAFMRRLRSRSVSVSPQLADFCGCKQSIACFQTESGLVANAGMFHGVAAGLTFSLLRDGEAAFPYPHQDLAKVILP